MHKIAGIQMRCSDSLDANLEKIQNLTKMAAERGAELIALQQLSSTKWFLNEKNIKHFEMSEEITGPTITFMQRLAKETKTILIPTFFERDKDRSFNTSVVIEKDGNIIGKYRKIHIPDIPLWEEKYYFSPGDEGFPIFKTSIGDIGIQICWDNFFPEGARILALKGAKIIIAPTASAFYSHPRWERVICANAISNNIFIFRINRVGKEGEQEFYGKSFCVNPYGELIAEPSGSKDGIIFSDVDWNEIRETRKIWGFFEDRRPVEYKEILTNEYI